MDARAAAGLSLFSMLVLVGASCGGVLDADVKKFLVGDGSAETHVQRAENASADLEYWMEWTPPTLQ